AVAPPEIDFVREDVERVVEGNRHVNGRGRRVATRRAHRRLRCEAPSTGRLLADASSQTSSQTGFADSLTAALLAKLASWRGASPAPRSYSTSLCRKSLCRSTHRRPRRRPRVAGLVTRSRIDASLRRSAPRALGVGLERGELFAPERLDVLDPRAQRVEGLAVGRVDAIARGAVGLLLGNEAALAQHEEVTADSRGRRTEGVGELTRALRTAAQELDGLASRRIGERREGTAQTIVAQTAT